MSLTVILIIVSIAASLYAWNNPDTYNKWMFNPYKISTQNQYYRFLTSGFIHADYVHLFINMYVFYSFGSALEYYFKFNLNFQSEIAFVALYLLAVVVSDIPSYFRHKNNPNYNALGASGAVAAIVFATIMFAPMDNLRLFFIIKLPGLFLGILFLIYSYYQSKVGKGNVGHEAHFYGALFGVVFTILIVPGILEHFWYHLINWQGF